MSSGAAWNVKDVFELFQDHRKKYKKKRCKVEYIEYLQRHDYPVALHDPSSGRLHHELVSVGAVFHLVHV